MFRACSKTIYAKELIITPIIDLESIYTPKITAAF